MKKPQQYIVQPRVSPRREAEVLRALAKLRKEWIVPKDIKAYRWSHHSRTLGDLCRKGEATRRVKKRFIDRNNYWYKITAKGLKRVRL